MTTTLADRLPISPETAAALSDACTFAFAVDDFARIDRYPSLPHLVQITGRWCGDNSPVYYVRFVDEQPPHPPIRTGEQNWEWERHLTRPVAAPEDGR